jgi:uncharacterized protein YaeQ
MAAPTLCHFEIAMNHVDRGIEKLLALRTAQHPSETSQRVWLRLLAYVWRYEERLEFGPGLSDPEQPDLIEKDLTGQTIQWIRVGKARAAKVQRAIDQNADARVSVLFESPAQLQAFHDDAAAEKITRLQKAELRAIDPALLVALARGDERRAKAAITFVGEHFYIEKDGTNMDGALTL